MSPYRIVVIEDQKMFRTFLAKMIEEDKDLQLVDAAGNGTRGWEICEQHNPDVVLLDLRLPDVDGIDLGKRIIKAFPRIAVLALTSSIDSYTTNTVYETGFHGYVEKEQSLDVLRDAIIAVAEGALYFTRLVHENRYKLQNDPLAFYKIVSPREIEVLAWVAGGLTSRKIGEKMGLSHRTIENHKYRIMKKIGVPSVHALVQYALKHGIDRKIAPKRERTSLE